VKQKLLLKLRLATIWLLILTSAIQAKAAEQTKAIGAGEVATFKGYLVPEWQFRKMNEDLVVKDLLEKKIPADAVVEDHSFRAFLLGVLSGSVLVIVAEKIGSR